MAKHRNSCFVPVYFAASREGGSVIVISISTSERFISQYMFFLVIWGSSHLRLSKTPILASSIKIGNVDDSGDATYTIMSRDIILRDEVALVSDSTPKAFEVPAFLGFFQLTWVPSLGGWWATQRCFCNGISMKFIFPCHELAFQTIRSPVCLRACFAMNRFWFLPAHFIGYCAFLVDRRQQRHWGLFLWEHWWGGNWNRFFSIIGTDHRDFGRIARAWSTSYLSSTMVIFTPPRVTKH